MKPMKTITRVSPLKAHLFSKRPKRRPAAKQPAENSRFGD